MAILNRDEFFNRLHDRIGSDTSDESISFLEDMTDTYNSLEQSANGDGTDWRQKYEELDEAWKKRYRHRFFSGNGGSNSMDDDITEKNNREVTFDDLFS